MSFAIETFIVGRKFWNIRWRAAMSEWEPKVSNILIDALRAEAPYDEDPWRDPTKPHLRDSLEFEIMDTGKGTEAQVNFYGPELAGLIEAGSPPHDIEGSPLLHFFFRSSGDEAFLASVMHPGFRRNRFVERAYAKSKDAIFGEFKAAVARAVVVE